MAYNQQLGYDPDLDYNRAISAAKDPNYIKELQWGLNNKINHQLGDYAAAYKSGASGITGTLDASVADLNNKLYLAKQEYAKANTGAYMSHMKAADRYGANAEQTAALGLINSGFYEKQKADFGRAYQTALNQNRTSFSNYNKDIDIQKNALTAQANAQKDNSFANYLNQYKNDIKAEQEYNYNKALETARFTGDYSGMAAYNWSKKDIKAANKRAK